MKTSEQINEIAAALAQVQAKFEPLKCNQQNTVKMKNGGEYTYAYADLPAIFDNVIGALSSVGIAVIQVPHFRDDGIFVLSTRLMHKSGQWYSGDYPISTDCSPQEMGSEITYARRYSLQSMTGVVAERDDDGKVADDGFQERPAAMGTKVEKLNSRFGIKPKVVVQVRK